MCQNCGAMEDFNPFHVSVYSGPEYFCDRDKETRTIIDFVGNQRNITLFSYRRLGKTGLIKHVFHTLQKSKNIKCLYLDILSCNELQDFTDMLATAIYNMFPQDTSIGKKIILAIQSLRPLITFDDLTGSPSISLRSELPHEKEVHLRQLFSFLEQKDFQVVLAIDEFQQILEFPEKNIEALLRTQMQQLLNVQFIFCGSNQKIMHEIFNSAKRPFFASCTPLYLDYIPELEYQNFIRFHFEKNNRTISHEAIDFICTWTLRHTYYTQYFCNYVYSNCGNNIEVNDVKLAAAQILVLHENSFYQFRSILTAGQWELLKAIAKEVRVHQPNSKKFIKTHGLGTPSSINRTLESLTAKEMIFYNTSVDKPYYEVYNKFLMRWLARL